MPKDIMDFMEHDSTKTEYIIDQLIRSDSGYGVCAGRTGLGKTNMMLNLSFWLALGKRFFNLKLIKSRVCYFAFEGGEDNLRDRYLRLMMREAVPDKDWLQVERLNNLVLLEKNNADRFRQMIKPFDVVLLENLLQRLLGRVVVGPVGPHLLQSSDHHSRSALSLGGPDGLLEDRVVLPGLLDAEDGRRPNDGPDAASEDVGVDLLAVAGAAHLGDLQRAVEGAADGLVA